MLNESVDRTAEIRPSGIIQVPVTEDYGLFKGKTNQVAFEFDIGAHYHADIDSDADGENPGDD